MAMCNFFLWKKKKIERKKEKIEAAINPETLKQKNWARIAGERSSVRAWMCCWKMASEDTHIPLQRKKGCWLGLAIHTSEVTDHILNSFYLFIK